MPSETLTSAELIAAVKVGDWMEVSESTVRGSMRGRAERCGEVIDVMRDGVALDFYATQRSLPSIEFYEWHELEKP